MIKSTRINATDIYNLINSGQLTTKVLDQPQEILEAKSLIYKVYIEEGKWNIPKSNLSGIRVAYHNNQPYLEDNFSEVSSWLGLYMNNQLIICIRVMDRLNGKFEVEHYQSIPKHLKQETLMVESNRLAVHSFYRGTIMNSIFTAFLHEYWISRNTSVLVTAPVPGVGNYYMKIAGFKKIDVPSFKYNQSEKETVSLLYLDLESAKKKRQMLQGMIQKTLQC